MKDNIKLQVALDIIDLKKALSVAEKVGKYVDIIELGTPLIKSAGAGAAKKFKKFKKLIVADFKVMDTGFLEAEMAFKSGADFVTVCGNASDHTIRGAVKAARKYKKKVVVDLISVKDIVKRGREVVKLGVDFVCLHTSIDIQKKNKGHVNLLTKDLACLSKKVNAKKIIVAGGINAGNVEKIKKYKPATVIVGGAITKNKNPGKAARELKERLK